MTIVHRPISDPVLYLDYDGVLHPDAVYRIKGKIVLKFEGARLFGWAPILADALDPFPDIRIVLSTSWVRVLSYDEARGWLPEPLAKRVIGATWHRSVNRDWWLGLTRYQQISMHAQRHEVSHWLAVDDDATGWPEERRGQLVCTDSMRGIAAPDRLALLLLRLRHLSGEGPGRSGE